MGPVTALAGVCLQDVERGAHEGGKRPLASRLRPVSSKATHPPTYLPLHRRRALRAAQPPPTPHLRLAPRSGEPRAAAAAPAMARGLAGRAPSVGGRTDVSAVTGAAAAAARTRNGGRPLRLR